MAWTSKLATEQNVVELNHAAASKVRQTEQKVKWVSLLGATTALPVSPALLQHMQKRQMGH